MTDAAGSPRAEDVRERAEKLLARVGEYPPEPWCNDAITLVRDLLALPAAGSPVSPDPTDRAPFPNDWQPPPPAEDLKVAGEAMSLNDCDEMLACIAAILGQHSLNGSTHAEMMRWKFRTLARLASSNRALQDERADAWLPTAANVNALPDPVRRYIHDLETRCDPSGDIRELTIARDTCQQQDRALAALRDERDRIERVAKMVGESADRANARMMAAESRLAALQDAIREVVEDPLETRSVLTAWGRRLLTLLPGSGTGET